MKVWLDRQGVAVRLGRWSVAYWRPGAWLPLSIRAGWQGRCGWWGAARVQRQPAHPHPN